MALLDAEGVLPDLLSLPFNTLSEDALACAHKPSYIERLRILSERGGGMLGLDTYVTPATYQVAALAAGAAVQAAKAVLNGIVTRAYALVRPPGHHAYPDHAEGFCLFNNVALAASYALGRLPGGNCQSVDRVMIIDWDVHHGNGSEAAFYDDPAVLYLSIHQSPLYPGTGAIHAIGAGAGRGMNINIPLPPGVGDQGYSRIFHDVVAPAARRFKPQLILVSAGYDAHWRDGLANMAMSLQGMADLMNTVLELSNELCESQLVVILEGGYDLEVLSYGVLNTFRILLGQADKVLDPVGRYANRETPVDAVIREVKRVHAL